MLKLSLIIPVYNEERHIRKCLDAVAAQTVMPDEVIVVDNNSTDATVAIAREYDFVKVIQEKRQGRGYARSRGFSAARGDIIGRIDADSRIQRDWVFVVKRAFEHDSELGGITGYGWAVVLPGTLFIRSLLMSRSYFWFVHAQFRTVTMWGANMAIRAEWWNTVRDEVCLDDQLVHEDQDISLCMAARGAKIVVSNDVRMKTNGQNYRYLPKLVHYAQLYMSTKRLHQRRGTFADVRMRKLGYITTFPGRVGALCIGLYIGSVALVLFPIDYFVKRTWPQSWWLD